MNTEEQKTTKVNTIEDNDYVDLKKLFMYYISKMKFLVFVFIIGAVIAGSLTHFCITPKYTSTAKLYMVSSSSGSAVDLSDLRIGDSLSADYLILMKIRPIYEDVKKDLGFEYSYGQFCDMVKVEAEEDTRVVIVTVESTDPNEAKDIANDITQKALYYLPNLMETPAPHIVETAIKPKAPSSPSLTRNTLLGALIFLFIAIAFYTIKFLLDDTLKTAEDVENEFGYDPIAVIPEGDLTNFENNNENAPSDGVKFNSLAELPYAMNNEIDRILSNVSRSGSAVKKIMIVSCVPNEGKSFVSMYLWKQMAKAQIPCAWLDFDLRKSVAVDKYGIETVSGAPLKGMSDVLSDDSDLSKALYATEYENAVILPNVEPHSNPSILYDGKNAQRFEDLINLSAEKYRYVLIDVPPVELVSDAEKICSQCDGVILVVRAGETSKKLVKSAIRKFERCNCDILGVVLNRSNTKTGNYYYYKKEYRKEYKKNNKK